MTDIVWLRISKALPPLTVGIGFIAQTAKSRMRGKDRTNWTSGSRDGSHLRDFGMGTKQKSTFRIFRIDEVVRSRRLGSWAENVRKKAEAENLSKKSEEEKAVKRFLSEKARGHQR